jgi:molybdenum cofactor guanylyltransferase
VIAPQPPRAAVVSGGATRPAGLILAGGQSRRMGRDKAALRFGPEMLLARSVRHLSQVASPIVISLAPEQVPDPAVAAHATELRTLRDLPIGSSPPPILLVRDDQAFGGPLPGLLHGFRALVAMRPAPSTVLVMPVDLPFYTPEWMRRVHDGLVGDGSDDPERGTVRACLYTYEGFVNPLVAAYDLALLPKLEALAAQPKARPLDLSTGEPMRVLDVDALWREEDGPPPLMDTDTPEDYARALALGGFAP